MLGPFGKSGDRISEPSSLPKSVTEAWFFTILSQLTQYCVEGGVEEFGGERRAGGGGGKLRECLDYFSV